MKKIFDLHCHASLKPLNSSSIDAKPCIPDYDIWRYRPPKDKSLMTSTVYKNKNRDKDSECNFDKAKAGNVKCMCLSLYPFEQGFMKLSGKNAEKNKKFDKTFSAILGFDVDRINYLQSKDRDYFQDLQEEYNLIVNNKLNNPQTGKWQYVPVNKYSDIEKAISENKLPVVLSIEGAGAFGLGTEKYLEMERLYPQAFEKEKKRFLSNVDIVKSWEYPPLFISPAHHFYNQVCGMSKSIADDSWLGEFIRPLLIDQEYRLPDGTLCYDAGFTDLGKKLIDKLLEEREKTINGKKVKFKRIFIDIKHLSGKARLEYFKILEKFNTNKNNPTVPIIASHTAVNGFPTIRAAIYKKDTLRKNKHKSAIYSRFGTRIDWFNRWSINLTDEEVRKIYDSKGLIGLLLDEGRLSNTEHLKLIKKQNGLILKEKYLEIFFNQIFHIVGEINDISAWDIISIGSDLDGGIDVMDSYRYKDLKAGQEEPESKGIEAISEIGDDLVKFWYKKLDEPKMNNPSARPYRKYLFDKTPEYFIEKIMWQNGMDFLKRWLK